MRSHRSMRRMGVVWWTSVAVLVIALGVYAPGAPAAPAITLYTDQVSGPAFMGLGTQFDPYDTRGPAQLNWPLITQRLDFMRPGVLRVVEPASDYFAGYDASGNPTYRWTSPHLVELLAILSYAQSRGITVVLGDWANPLIKGDARIPADFIGALHRTYGDTVVRYYNVMNEPNGAGPSCPFTCWTGIMKAVSAEFTQLGFQSWIRLVGPDNANSWDDTQVAQALDRTSGLETDNPLGGDSWVTGTLQSIPSLVGAYDSHRYATVWGVQNGVYADQVRARREEISNLDSPSKPYFAGEVGLTARQVTPFAARGVGSARPTQALRSLLDPSAIGASTFVDSQPNIESFNYGIWMGDMMIQAVAAGLSGASAWDLDDAMHVGGGYGAQNLKQWGFWNSLGGQNGYPASDLVTRPWYYAWSVISRAFPAGAQALVVPSTGVPGVRVAAARIPDGTGYDVSIAMVNDSATPSTIALSLPAVTRPLTLAQYDYFPAGQPVDANGLPAPAQTLAVQPSTGVTVQLPANGLVVLTSRGFAAPVALDQGTTTLVDGLLDWHLTYAHSRALKLDHRTPMEFNYAASRATPTGKHNQFLAYRANQIASFELKAYYPKALRILAYGSADGTTWTPITLASTAPSPAVGGHQMLAEALPGQALPAGTNRLKVVLGPGTELAQVRIMAGRSGPACLATDLATGAGAIGAVALGATGRSILGRLGVPSMRGRHAWGYCVTGGGAVGVVLTRRDVASLILSTASGYRLRG
ncbi:MAG: glycoside hydrolase family 5 protein, partial [Actinomycetota bacterium]|nr:glycoside hydrolase family 5 protein [Actinomycetota bacterium]